MSSKKTRNPDRGEKPAARPRGRSHVEELPVASSRPTSRVTIAAILVAFALVFAGLSVFSYLQKSATWDEPIHVTTGYLSLARGDHRVDPEHPPFLRMWAALPLLWQSPLRVDTGIIDRSPPTQWALNTLFPFSHRFMYRDNDADRLLYPSRFMIVILGVVLGCLVFAWAYEWLGVRGAVFAVAFYTLEPNIAAHSALVTTDLGLACFAFGTVYFLWRSGLRPGAGNTIGAVVFFALAVISKFSAIILVPIAVTLLATAVWHQQSLRPSQALLVFVGMVLVAWTAIWAVYGFRYAPGPSADWLYRFQDHPDVRQRVPGLASLVGWADTHRLLPNEFTQGFLIGQAKAQSRLGFLAGEISTEGWWYYFPFALLIKTPIAFLLLSAIGLVVLLRAATRQASGPAAYILIPPILFVAVPMTSHLNIGVRHVLPAVPFAILLAAGAADWLASRTRWSQALLSAVLSFWVWEFVTVYPHTLAFFNQLVGGPSNGSRYLADSNIDWGQDLKPLKKWMVEQRVEHINLAYFGTADPAYYQINCTYLPGSPGFVRPDQIGPPKLPGYVAVSATILTGVNLDPQERQFYRPLLDRQPATTIGHSIAIYWIEKPWW